MKIKLSQIVKRFDQNVIVDHVDLEIESGEMFFLLGPSGCGKTTILRMLAGFYDPEKGDIFFNQRRMNGAAAHTRNTALVFQNYAIWPHMTVYENVAYGLRVRKTHADELDRRVKAALGKVKMEALAERKPASLSGGQQQRVALARAIVVNPDLLLFDEPLCNLDAKLRLEMRAEIKRLHAETRITSLYVTHDQEEALSLATRIAVMHGGRIQQVGTPVEIYNHPANPFVASFIGEINMLPPGSALARKLGARADAQCGFRPEHVRVASEGVTARVLFSSYLGSKNELLLETGDGEQVKAWVADYHAEGSEIRFTVAEGHLLHYGPEAAVVS
jgi:iron(III) transport system ATP-binding protein